MIIDLTQTEEKTLTFSDAQQNCLFVDHIGRLMQRVDQERANCIAYNSGRLCGDSSYAFDDEDKIQKILPITGFKF
jgi:hypothetical protein